MRQYKINVKKLDKNDDTIEDDFNTYFHDWSLNTHYIHSSIVFLVYIYVET